MHFPKYRLFLKNFSIYLLLIVFPVICAGLLANFYFAEMMRNEVAKSDRMMADHLRKTMDDMFERLRAETISLLVSPQIALASSAQHIDPDIRNLFLFERIDEIRTLINVKLGLFGSVDSIYVYFKHLDIVISSDGHYAAEDFFAYKNIFVGRDWNELFSGRKVVSMTEPLEIQKNQFMTGRMESRDMMVSFISGYPMDSPRPDAYLVFNLKAKTLLRMIAIGDGTERTVALFYDGEPIVKHDAFPDVSIGVPDRDAEAEDFLEKAGGKEYQVSLQKSTYDDRMTYAIATDTAMIRKPAETIKRVSWLFMLFFSVLGVFVSLKLSHTAVSPILRIKSGMETFSRKLGLHLHPAASDEMAYIEKWSGSVMSQYKDLYDRLSEMRPVLHEHFTARFLEGEFQDELAIRYLCREIHLELSMTAPKAVILVSFQYRPHQTKYLSVTDRSFLMMELKSDIRRSWPQPVWFARTDHRQLACIIELSSPEERTEAAFMIREVLLRYHNELYADIGVGGAPSDAGKLHEAYLQAKQALRWKPFSDRIDVLGIGEHASEDEIQLNADLILTDEDNQKIKNVMRTNSKSDLLELIRGLADAATQADAVLLSQVQRFNHDLIDCLMKAWDGVARDGEPLEKYAEWKERADRCRTREELMEFYRSFLDELMGDGRHDPTERHQLMEETIQYIESHFRDDISMEILADRLHISLGHFSRLFKERVGEKYSDYVTRLRMNEAKRLLTETDRKVEDIAAEVGYFGVEFVYQNFQENGRRNAGAIPAHVREGGEMIIDCDVHHARRNSKDLLPYLPEPWKTEVAKYGERKMLSGILFQEGGMRWDSYPEEGGPAGSDYETMRKQLLDKYQYRFALLTGSGHRITGIPDPDYAQAICSAHNDYTIEHWLPKDKRFKTVIWVAHQDPQLAAREVDRLGDHPDVVAVWFSSTATIPFGNRHYYPIYEAAQRKGLPVGVHPGQGGAMLAQASPTAAGMARTYLEWHVGVSQAYMAHTASLILEGVFERFPGLKFFLVEGGFAWLPHLMWRMDSHFKGLRQQAPYLKRLPSEYVADHIRVTTQPMEEPKKEEHLLQIFDMMDAANILMYASDYPHWDFDEPSVLPRKLSEDQKRSILFDNAAELFGLQGGDPA